MGDLALANITFKTISFKRRCDQKVLGEGRLTQNLDISPVYQQHFYLDFYLCDVESNLATL